MPAKLLVDTSAWIVSFRKSGHEQLKKTLVSALDSFSVATTNIVILELLQGCRNKNEYDAMHARLNILETILITDAAWSLAYATGGWSRRAIKRSVDWSSFSNEIRKFLRESGPPMSGR